MVRSLNSALLLLAVSIVSQCPPATTRYALSPGHRAHIRAEVLTPVTHVQDLPETVREAMRKSFGEANLKLADPNEPFQANLWQMLRSPRTPAKRLVSAASGPDHCLVHYEEGGYRHSFRVLLFGLNRSDAQIEWAGTPSKPLADVAGMKRFVLQE